MPSSLLPWRACSEAALLSLGADIAVFVGDFGEENVQVRAIGAAAGWCRHSDGAGIPQPWPEPPPCASHCHKRFAELARTLPGSSDSAVLLPSVPPAAHQAHCGAALPKGCHTWQPRRVVRAGAVLAGCGARAALRQHAPMLCCATGSGAGSHAAHHLPALSPDVRRFSLTKNGRQRYARAMAASTTLAAQQQQAFSAGACAASNAWARALPPACLAPCGSALFFPAAGHSALGTPWEGGIPRNKPHFPAERCPRCAGGSTPAIAAQLQALGDDHIGYSSKRFDHLGLSLLGARPFSKGGKQWSDVAGGGITYAGARPLCCRAAGSGGQSAKPGSCSAGCLGSHNMAQVPVR